MFDIADFGIVGGDKALPHAADLAGAIEAAFQEAKTLLAVAAPGTGMATAVSVDTTKPFATTTTQKLAGKATQGNGAVALGKPLLRKLISKADTELRLPSTRQTRPTPTASDASRHGKTVSPATRAAATATGPEKTPHRAEARPRPASV